MFTVTELVGGDFVNFGFRDGEYVLGIYTGLSNDYDPPLINGKTGTIDQMNQIYPTDYASYSEDDLKEMVQLVREGNDWTIHLPSGEIVTLDESFDFDRFLWEQDELAGFTYSKRFLSEHELEIFPHKAAKKE